MANPARAAAEAALRARKLDRTLTDALPTARGDRAAPTAVTRLDTVLGGGLPRGELSEIVGPHSSGRTALLLQLVAAATQRGEIAALVDTFDRLDVASAAAAGIDLDRLLWIRGVPVSRTSDSCLLTPVSSIERALKALNLVLQAGGFGVVAIELADAPRPAMRAIPFTTWLRVQRTIEGSDTACVIVGPQPLGRSAGGLTLATAARPRWSSILTGLDMTVRIISPRRQLDTGVGLGADVR